ncbi:unnamed protein product [Polarella glacialis]|uniref:Uncharacterized protein n=1 Tax=Polarella glacialis TaxID=89957 RepID=A0A813D789_POLGL|nr:unnamed protein product [Polarella glacialis]
MPLACPFEICRVALNSLSPIVGHCNTVENRHTHFMPDQRGHTWPPTYAHTHLHASTDMRLLARFIQGGLRCRLMCCAQPGGLGGFLGATCSGRRSSSILKALKRPPVQLADSVAAKVGPGLFIPICTSRADADSGGGEDDAPTSS